MPIKGNTLEVPTARVFVPLLRKRRYRGAKGGRGSGKSRFFGEDLVVDMMTSHIRAVCAREFQNSIDDSSKQLIEDEINRLGVLASFKITDKEIICPAYDSVAIFRGLHKSTASSIKSLEGYNRLWVDEAQTLSARSIELATPTFRAVGSVMDFSWNPVDKSDPIEKLFSDQGVIANMPSPDPDFILVHANYSDNPWFPDDLRKDMERDRRRDIDKYNHVWLGKYRTASEARVFKNWSIREFDTPANARFYFGADWGFATDPTVLVRSWADHNSMTLFIDQEVHSVGVAIDDTPALFRLVPGSTDWPITADSARPETIDYMIRHGFPRMKAAVKGTASVMDGIEFLKSYDIVVHPRCVHVIDELSTYSFKIDPKTNEILPILADRKNHTIDAIRYALEGTRRSSYSLDNV